MSVHLSAHLSFSDETVGVLLVLMGHVVGTAVSSSLCWLTRRKALHGRTGWPLAGIKWLSCWPVYSWLRGHRTSVEPRKEEWDIDTEPFEDRRKYHCINEDWRDWLYSNEIQTWITKAVRLTWPPLWGTFLPEDHWVAPQWADISHYLPGHE